MKSPPWLRACRNNFSNNDFHYFFSLSVSLIVVEDFWPTHLYNMAWVLCDLWPCVSEVLPHPFNHVEVWTQVDHYNTSSLFFFSHSVVDLLLCLGSLLFCHDPVWSKLIFRLEFPLVCRGVHCWFKDCEVSRSTANSSPLLHPCLTFGMMCLLICCLVFVKHVVVYYVLT